MNKLIKLSDTHYIIVDDSKIKEDDYYLNLEPENPTKSKIYRGLKLVLKNGYEGNGYKDKDYFKKYMRKIIHSTQPLEKICCTPIEQIKRYVECKGCDKEQMGYDKIKPLSLSEIEEVINGYSVENVVKNYVQELIDCKSVKEHERTWISAICRQMFFKADKELVKDKLFTIENLKLAWELGAAWGDVSLVEAKKEQNSFVQSLLPKTEWDIELVDGKIKLI